MKHIVDYRSWMRLNESETVEAPAEAAPEPAPAGGGTGGVTYEFPDGKGGVKTLTDAQVRGLVGASINWLDQYITAEDSGLYTDLVKQMEDNWEANDTGWAAKSGIRLAMKAIGLHSRVDTLVKTFTARLRSRTADLSKAIGERNGARVGQIYSESLKTAIQEFWKTQGGILKSLIKKGISMGNEQAKELQAKGIQAVTLDDTISKYTRRLRRSFIGMIGTIGVSQAGLAAYTKQLTDAKTAGKPIPLDSTLLDKSKWVNQAIEVMQKESPNEVNFIKSVLGDALKPDVATG